MFMFEFVRACMFVYEFVRSRVCVKVFSFLCEISCVYFLCVYACT